MEEDDVYAAVQDAQQQFTAPSGGGTSWDGRVAVNRQTGQRLVYRVNPTGHGRWMALSADTAAPAARERVGELTTRSQTGRRTLGLAREFVDLNATANTGGIQNDPNLPEFIRGAAAPNAQRFASLSNQMIGSNWQPGTSGMMNTATEQNMMRQRYPAPTNRGDVNQDVYLQMAEDVGVQEAAVTDMRRWLSEHPTLDGWDQHWGQIESRLRPQIRNRATREYNSRREQARSGAQRRTVAQMSDAELEAIANGR